MLALERVYKDMLWNPMGGLDHVFAFSLHR